MRIAVIGWGSLIWSERELEVEKGSWRSDGPLLPVEFSRISSDRRLTLVIDPRFRDITTYWKLSALKKVADARENLRIREVTPDLKDIGYLDITNGGFGIGNSKRYLLNRIESWMIRHQLDASIWTDLEPRFEQITGNDLNLENATEFLSTLSGDPLRRAFEYIVNTPQQTVTELRDGLENFIKGRAPD